MADDLSAASWMRLVELARVVMNDDEQRAVDRAAWLGAVIRLRAATTRLKGIVPSAVPLGFGAWSEVELLRWWRADPITPIRTILAGADKPFAGRPGFFEQVGGGLSDFAGLVWRIVMGVIIAVGVLVTGAFAWCMVRK